MQFPLQVLSHQSDRRTLMHKVIRSPGMIPVMIAVIIALVISTVAPRPAAAASTVHSLISSSSLAGAAPPPTRASTTTNDSTAKLATMCARVDSVTSLGKDGVKLYLDSGDTLNTVGLADYDFSAGELYRFYLNGHRKNQIDKVRPVTTCEAPRVTPARSS